MHFLVSDTSVLIDLGRGTLLEAVFRLQDAFVVPDLLYEQELKSEEGPRLQQLGLRVEPLPPEMVIAAAALRREHPALSVPDCFALVLAEANRWTLLTGDGRLRALALRRQLDCHGVLWLLDRMLVEAVATAAALHAGLTAIAMHPRCRLPARDVRERITNYAELGRAGR
jgi:hypothetical protein